MAAANIGSTGIVLEVLTKDNYIDWRVVVKNYLIGKGLWENIVEGNLNDIDKKYSDWKLKNGQALHAIQLSCSTYSLSQIRNCETAHEAWNNLKQIFSEDVRVDDYDIELGVHQTEIEKFHVAIKKGMWIDALSFITTDRDIISQKSLSKGWTSLHIVADAGQREIIKELFEKGALLTERDWEGYTPFALAAKSTDDVEIVEWMLNKGGNDLLTMKIKNNSINDDDDDDDKYGGGDIPVLLAAAQRHKKMTTFLFSKTQWSTLINNNCYYAYKLLSYCIQAEIFDVALALLQHDGIQLPLSYETEECRRPILGLAHIPTAFPSGIQLNDFGQIYYDVLRIPTDIDLGGGKTITINPHDEGTNTCKCLRGWTVILHSLFRSLTFTLAAILLYFVQEIFQVKKLPYTKKIYEIKRNHYLVREILRCLSDRVEKVSSKSELHQWSVHEAMLQAGKSGIKEFLISMKKANPNLLWVMDKQKKGIFAHAISNRHEKMLKLLREIEDQKDLK